MPGAARDCTAVGKGSWRCACRRCCLHSARHKNSLMQKPLHTLSMHVSPRWMSLCCVRWAVPQTAEQKQMITMLPIFIITDSENSMNYVPHHSFG